MRHAHPARRTAGPHRNGSPLALLAALGFLAASCGGGSSAPIGGLPDGLAFTQVLGDAAPPPALLHVSFQGEGLIVGTPPGVAQADWLQVTSPGVHDSPVDVTVAASGAFLMPGRYQTTLRFITGKLDGSVVHFKDLPVVLQIGVGLAPGTEELAFASIDGAGAPAGQPLTLDSDLRPFDWSVEIEAVAGPVDWLSLSAASGRGATGPVSLTVHAAARPPGEYLALLAVKDGAGVVRRRVSVRHVVAGVMTLSDPALITLTQASTPADLVRQVTMRSALDPSAFPGVTWTASTDLPWLTVEPASGALAASTPLTLRVDASRLTAPPGAVEGGAITVTLHGVSRSPSSLGVLVQAALPRLDAVLPRQAFAGVPTRLRLRGAGFSPSLDLPIRFGDQVVTGLVVSDTEVRVTAPALAAGSHVTGVDNAIGFRRDGPPLQVLPQPGYQAAALDLPGPAMNLTLDPLRQAVLFSGAAETLERARWKDGAWIRDGYAGAAPNGVAVDLTGQQLIVAGRTAASSHPFHVLAAETLEFLFERVYPYGTYLDRYDLIAPLSDGQTFLVNSDQWSYYLGFPDLLARGMVGTWGTTMLETADLDRLLFAGSLTGDVFSFDVGSGFVARSFPRPASRGAWAVSAHGDRLLIGAAVLDRDFIARGDVTGLEGPPVLVAVSRDATRGYLLSRPDQDAAWTLRAVDLSAGTGPYPADAAPLPLTLGAGTFPQAMAVSADGGALFLLASTPGAPGTPARYTFHALPLAP